MQPETWSREWHYPLLQCHQDENRIPQTAREFLKTFGLPSVMIFEFHSSFEISFAPLKNYLRPYNSTIQWGDVYSEELDREWSHQFVLGEEEFCNGRASFCVYDHDGTVNRLDCELDNSMCFVNSTVELFGMSLLFAQKWSVNVHDHGAMPTLESFETLINGLKRCDPRAFDDGKCFWPSMIEHAIGTPEGDVPDLVITSDPKRSKPRF